MERKQDAYYVVRVRRRVERAESGSLRLNSKANIRVTPEGFCLFGLTFFLKSQFFETILQCVLFIFTVLQLLLHPFPLLYPANFFFTPPSSPICVAQMFLDMWSSSGVWSTYRGQHS